MMICISVSITMVLSPTSLKSWFDKVLSYNWAYGENYNLSGKTFRVVLTTGGVTEVYLTSTKMA